MSFAIFVNETATTFIWAEASTRPSRAACASNGSAGAPIVRPVSSESLARTRSANSGCVLRPVPTAVPPRGIWPTRSSEDSMRPMPWRTCAAYPANSWPSVTGTASIRWVRPDLTTSSNSAAFASSDCASRSSAGRRSLVSWSSVARWTAEGKTSLDDWPMFTSSFACTPSPARLAMTSFAFMLDDVPEPVWKTSIGNWSSSSPPAIRSAAAAIRSAFSWSRSPSSAFARAAAALIRPSQRATCVGIGSPDTWKFSTAFFVSVPQSSSTSPSLTWPDFATVACVDPH